MQILYEDNHLLVVVKPPNLPVQADASGDDDLLSQCKRYIKETCNKPGEVYLGLVHRLDRPAGGVLVFARTSKAAARLCAQFKGRGAHKQYALLTPAEVAKPALSLRPVPLRDWLLRAESTSRLVPPNTPGAQEAALHYQSVARAGDLTLLDVTLLSGRHHQIRVQMAGHGMPLFGDQRYNPAARPGQQLALWAYALTLEHPTLHTRMTFTALPEGTAWRPFARQLAAMARGLRVAFEDENLLCLVKPTGLETSPSGADVSHASTVETNDTDACIEQQCAPRLSPSGADVSHAFTAEARNADTCTEAGCAPRLSPSGEDASHASTVETSNTDADTLLARACALCGAPVYAVHRLDVNTTGLVLFAKTPAVRDALRDAIEKRQIDKFYRCLVKGMPTPPAATLTAWLVKDERAARVTVYDRPVPDAKEIVTAYTVLGEATDGAVPLEVQLLSGRTHQIRAHLAHIGHPILGDDKYGARAWNKAQKCSLPQLCAVRLAFHLPAQSPLAYMNDTVIAIAPPFR